MHYFMSLCKFFWKYASEMQSFIELFYRYDYCSFCKDVTYHFSAILFKLFGYRLMRGKIKWFQLKFYGYFCLQRECHIITKWSCISVVSHIFLSLKQDVWLSTLNSSVICWYQMCCHVLLCCFYIKVSMQCVGK